VNAAMASDEIVVAIADRGIGIPAHDRDRLFERYHRGSNVSGIVGTGVGLYLVKMVVDLHGGGVDVESTEGDGSRFTVRLPIIPPAKADVLARAVEQAANTSPAAARLIDQPVE